MGNFKAPVTKKNKTAKPTVKESKEVNSPGGMEYLNSKASTFQLNQFQDAADDQVKGSRIAQLQSKSDQFTGLSRLAQLQANAYAQETDIHLEPNREKHLTHEPGHVVQQKEDHLEPAVQLKDEININDDNSLEKEADVLGEKANLIGKAIKKESEVGVVQQKGEDVLQENFTQGSVTQLVDKLEEVSVPSKNEEGQISNNATPEQIEDVRKKLADGLTKEQILEDTDPSNRLQISTALARVYGDKTLTIADGPTIKTRQANPYDKYFTRYLTQANQELVEAGKANIPTPDEIFTKDAIDKHLDKFAKGAHAFVDPNTSEKIMGTIEDPKFEGWGLDNNFVAPLEEADKLNDEAKNTDPGIITLENKLGIKDYNWSRSDYNPKKEMIRWTIPEPKNFKLDGKEGEEFLTMATGNETGAAVNEWVAGGFTLGGFSEAVVKAIPREQLLIELNAGNIKKDTVFYEKTPDNIGKEGPGSLPNSSKYYRRPFRSRG